MASGGGGASVAEVPLIPLRRWQQQHCSLSTRSASKERRDDDTLSLSRKGELVEEEVEPCVSSSPNLIDHAFIIISIEITKNTFSRNRLPIAKN